MQVRKQLFLLTNSVGNLVMFQSQWEKRVLKSLNSMCVELGQTLAKPRCQVLPHAQEVLTHQRTDLDK